jgi:hypothetical protein
MTVMACESVLRPLTPLYNALEIPIVVTPFDARQCFKTAFALLRRPYSVVFRLFAAADPVAESAVAAGKTDDLSC